MEQRYIQRWIQEGLNSKMVFIAGPRQRGKTTIAREILQGYQCAAYFNLDNDFDRRIVLKQQWERRAFSP
jgi:hypothetical protein